MYVFMFMPLYLYTWVAYIYTFIFQAICRHSYSQQLALSEQIRLQELIQATYRNCCGKYKNAQSIKYH